jgi:hypothetical protein
MLTNGLQIRRLRVGVPLARLSPLRHQPRAILIGASISYKQAAFAKAQSQADRRSPVGNRTSVGDAPSRGEGGRQFCAGADDPGCRKVQSRCRPTGRSMATPRCRNASVQENTFRSLNMAKVCPTWRPEQIKSAQRCPSRLRCLRNNSTTTPGPRARRRRATRLEKTGKIGRAGRRYGLKQNREYWTTRITGAGRISH